MNNFGPTIRTSSRRPFRRLHEAVWAPIGQALPLEVKWLFISPDGQLNFVSFATLVGKDQQFLADRYEVQYVASGRDLLQEPKTSTAKDVVLFADPAFDLASGRTQNSLL